MINLSELWQENELMPVAAVDYKSNIVLMIGYMNKAAFAYTLKTRKVWYYDEEKDDAVMFGAKDGNIQRLVSMNTDYNKKSLLVYVDQVGHVCHENGSHRTCFIHNIYHGEAPSVAKHRKFGKVEVDKNFDYSTEDYDED
ncbi:MAG: phosphoribosyl-AMP cyclohydrolase [Clostridia bacterium]|nr:phosphoribosyl-AMP cyclohydrolase [Clostridia bacterium]